MSLRLAIKASLEAFQAARQNEGSAQPKRGSGKDSPRGSKGPRGPRKAGGKLKAQSPGGSRSVGGRSAASAMESSLSGSWENMGSEEESAESSEDEKDQQIKHEESNQESKTPGKQKPSIKSPSVRGRRGGGPGSRGGRGRGRQGTQAGTGKSTHTPSHSEGENTRDGDDEEPEEEARPAVKREVSGSSAARRKKAATSPRRSKSPPRHEHEEDDSSSVGMIEDSDEAESEGEEDAKVHVAVKNATKSPRPLQRSFSAQSATKTSQSHVQIERGNSSGSKGTQRDTPDLQIERGMSGGSKGSPKNIQHVERGNSSGSKGAVKETVHLQVERASSSGSKGAAKETVHLQVERASSSGSKGAAKDTPHIHIERATSTGSKGAAKETPHVHIERGSSTGSKGAAKDAPHVHIERGSSGGSKGVAKDTPHVHIERGSSSGSKGATKDRPHAHIERGSSTGSKGASKDTPHPQIERGSSSGSTKSSAKKLAFGEPGGSGDLTTLKLPEKSLPFAPAQPAVTSTVTPAAAGDGGGGGGGDGPADTTATTTATTIAGGVGGDSGVDDGVAAMETGAAEEDAGVGAIKPTLDTPDTITTTTKVSPPVSPQKDGDTYTTSMATMHACTTVHTDIVTITQTAHTSVSVEEMEVEARPSSVEVLSTKVTLEAEVQEEEEEVAMEESEDEVSPLPKPLRSAIPSPGERTKQEEELGELEESDEDEEMDEKRGIEDSDEGEAETERSVTRKRKGPSRKRMTSTSHSSVVNDRPKPALQESESSEDDGEGGRRRVTRSTAKKEEPDDDEDNMEEDDDKPVASALWVECTNCRKWRKCPAHWTDAMVSKLPELWTCSQNTWDPVRASCDAPEEEEDAIEADDDSSEEHEAGTDVRQRKRHRQTEGMDGDGRDSERKRGGASRKRGQPMISARAFIEKTPRMASVTHSSSEGSRGGQRRRGSGRGRGSSRGEAALHAHTPSSEGGAVQEGVTRSMSLDEGRTQAMSSPAGKQRLKVQQRREVDANGESTADSKVRAWVQCDQCGKWRKLPPHMKEEDLKEEKWFCHMAHWTTRLTCTVPEGAESALFRPPPPGAPSLQTSTSTPNLSGGQGPSVPMSPPMSTRRGRPNSLSVSGKGLSASMDESDWRNQSMDSIGVFAQFDGPLGQSGSLDRPSSSTSTSTRGRGRRSRADSTCTPRGGDNWVGGITSPRRSVSAGAMEQVEKPPLPPPQPSQDCWVECDNCRKWRRLPPGVDTDKLPQKWYCKDNIWDPKRQSCDVEQEPEVQHVEASLTGTTNESQPALTTRSRAGRMSITAQSQGRSTLGTGKKPQNDTNKGAGWRDILAQADGRLRTVWTDRFNSPGYSVFTPFELRGKEHLVRNVLESQEEHLRFRDVDVFGRSCYFVPSTHNAPRMPKAALQQGPSLLDTARRNFSQAHVQAVANSRSNKWLSLLDQPKRESLENDIVLSVLRDLPPGKALTAAQIAYVVARRRFKQELYEFVRQDLGGDTAHVNSVLQRLDPESLHIETSSSTPTDDMSMAVSPSSSWTAADTSTGSTHAQAAEGGAASGSLATYRMKEQQQSSECHTDAADPSTSSANALVAAGGDGMSAASGGSSGGGTTQGAACAGASEGGCGAAGGCGIGDSGRDGVATSSISIDPASTIQTSQSVNTTATATMMDVDVHPPSAHAHVNTVNGINTTHHDDTHTRDRGGVGGVGCVTGSAGAGTNMCASKSAAVVHTVHMLPLKARKPWKLQ